MLQYGHNAPTDIFCYLYIFVYSLKELFSKYVIAFVFFIADIFDDELHYIAMSGEMFGEIVCEMKGCKNVDTVGFRYCTQKIFPRLVGLERLVPQFSE